MMNKKTALRQLIQLGERIYKEIPQSSTLPRGKAEITESFVVDSDELMRQMAAEVDLTAEAVMSMIHGTKWTDGIGLKPIDAALLAPAFGQETQRQVVEALELAQRKFWGEQYFYLDEMAGRRALDIPNALMRETSLAIEERAVDFLRKRIEESVERPIVWADYAAGPASFVNGALQRLQEDGKDISRVRVVLVEPAGHFREFAQQQPVLCELKRQEKLHFVDGVLEDGETYDNVKNVFRGIGVDCADIVTQAFGASYVADHLRPVMWKEMFGTARHNGLKMVVATTNKYQQPQNSPTWYF